MKAVFFSGSSREALHHFGIFLAGFGVRRGGLRMSSRTIKCLVVTGFAAIGLWLLTHPCLQFGHISSSNPRSTFEYLVTKPIPLSVGPIQEGGLRTMDSVFRVLSFKMAAADLYKLLDLQGYKPLVNDELTREDYLKRWERRIEESANLKVHFTADWNAYRLVEGHGTKYIFCDTNTSAVVFVADAH